MSILLFSLKNVPDDEAEDVRQLLASNSISFYETPAGKWGISSPAIWLHGNEELQRAKALIEAYQKERFIRNRGEFESLKSEGKHRTIVHALAENPLRFVLYLAIIAVVLYFSIAPFFRLGG